jgi:hypothetical protein
MNVSSSTCFLKITITLFFFTFPFGVWLAAADGNSMSTPPRFVENANHERDLEMDGVRYKVTRTGVRDRYIDVYEATLSLPEGFEPRTLKVRNFIIDESTGYVSMAADFAVDALTITLADGTAVTSNDFMLGKTGSLLMSGKTVSVAYGVLSTTGVRLTNEGADWSATCVRESFSGSVYGYQITSSAARLTAQGIYLETGQIRMYGAERRFSGLGLSLVALDRVYAEGTILDSFSIDSGYGDPVTVHEGKVGARNVYASIDIRVPSVVSAWSGSDVWTLEGIGLNSDASFAGSDLRERTLKVGGYSVVVRSTSFTGTQVSLDSPILRAPSGFSTDSVKFNPIRFNYGGIIDNANANGEWAYSFGGWTLEYEELVLDDRGLGGKGCLMIPGQFLQGSIIFPESRIGPDGSVFSGEALPDFDDLLIGYVLVRFPGATLARAGDSYILSCPAPRMVFGFIEDVPDLVFGPCEISDEGVFLRTEAGDDPLTFESANSYRVRAERYRLTDSKVEITGAVSCMGWKDSEWVPIESIELCSDSAVVADNITDTVMYTFGEWTVYGKGFHFEYEDINIDENEIRYRGYPLALGALSFGNEGGMGTSCTDQDVVLDLFGGRARLGSVCFDNDGLSGSICVTLPEQLGGNCLHYEPVMLSSDGTFFAQDQIDQYCLDVNGFSFKFYNLCFYKDGLMAGDTKITLPKTLDGVSLELTGLVIDNSGVVSSSDYKVTPFDLWGMNFWIDDLSIVSGVVTFTGQLILPETLPGSLSSRWVKIRDFRVDLGGTVLAFYASLEGTYTIPFIDSLMLSVKGLDVIYDTTGPWIVFSQAVLIFPYGGNIDQAPVENVRFNPVTGEFDFNSIKASPEVIHALDRMRDRRAQ